MHPFPTPLSGRKNPLKRLFHRAAERDQAVGVAAHDGDARFGQVGLPVQAAEFAGHFGGAVAYVGRGGRNPVGEAIPHFGGVDVDDGADFRAQLVDRCVRQRLGRSPDRALAAQPVGADVVTGDPAIVLGAGVPEMAGLGTGDDELPAVAGTQADVAVADLVDRVVADQAGPEQPVARLDQRRRHVGGPRRRPVPVDVVLDDAFVDHDRLVAAGRQGVGNS